MAAEPAVNETQDTRSLLRRALSDSYWRLRWWVSWHIKTYLARLRVKSEARRIAECPLFDADWYLTVNSDVSAKGIDPAMHYLRYGSAEGRDPGPSFSTIGYLARYPDVASSGINPLLHYLDVGAQEARQIGADSTRPSGQRLVFICSEPQMVGFVYRIAHLVSAMKAAGAEAEWMTPDWAIRNLKSIAEATLLALWRTPYDDKVAVILRIARTNGAVIMFDADDLVIEPQIAKISIIDGIRTQNLTEEEVETFYQRTLTSFGEADWGCCSTEELAAAMRRRGMTTFVIPNGFTDELHRRARLALRHRRAAACAGLIRIGYAAGTRTHQRDFERAAGAIASLLRKRPDCRLVLFRKQESGTQLLDPSEFELFDGLESQIEWRDFVAHDVLSNEIARFDINIAPLEFGNPFCEAKSELKFVEAALLEVCTVASPTGPFRRAIRHGETGFLVDGQDEWESTLLRLVNDPELRRDIGRAAYRSVLWRYGAHRRAELAAAVLDQTLGSARAAARAGVVQMQSVQGSESSAVFLPRYETVFESDRLKGSDLTVIVPLYNYDRYVVEALDSVAAQTLEEIDLIVVNDASTDRSLEKAESWIRANVDRFNRVLLLSNVQNAGLGPTRNAAIDAAETAFILPLDADNR